MSKAPTLSEHVFDGARSRISALLRRRAKEPQEPGIKVNLYRNYEYRALVRARSPVRIECVMVGDSYFMTHLGRDSTNLSEEDSALAFELLPRLVGELRTEIDRDELATGRPLLMADIPSGLGEGRTRTIIERFAAEGADLVKAEIASEDDMWRLDEIRAAGLSSALHLGYTPQTAVNQTYGRNASEVTVYLRLLDAARDRHDACAVIFERVTEVANVVLSRHARSRGMLSYSIFSGRTAYGGQSLNVWDAVVKAGRASAFLPPTARLERAEVEGAYTLQAISECIGKLLSLTAAGLFPPSPNNRLDVETSLDILELAPR